MYDGFGFPFLLLFIVRLSRLAVRLSVEAAFDAGVGMESSSRSIMSNN